MANSVSQFILAPILFLLLSTFSGSALYSKDIVVNGSRIERSLLQMYEEDDIAECGLFVGHFLNFGYWEGIPIEESITQEQRLESNQAMYRLIISAIHVSSSDAVLEVGCGQGVGAALVCREINPLIMRAIDLSPSQIQRARELNHSLIENGQNLSFRCGSAYAIPFPQGSFEKVISIEVAQHFDKLEVFCGETYRVLKSKGRLAVTTFFANSPQSHDFVAPMIQTIRDGIDKMNPIESMKLALKNSGYIHVKIQSIGDHVWPQFDQWMAQTELKNSWGRNWLKAYKANLLDYYLITAEKP